MKKSFILLSLCTLLVCCKNEQADQKLEEEKLMQLTTEWGKAALEGDLEKTLSYWATDASVMSPNTSTKNGQDEIRQMVEGAYKIPGFKITWEPKDAYVSTSGDLGYTTTYHYFTMQDSLGNEVKTFGKGVEIWKKQSDGSWKIVVDIYNADPTITTLK